MSNTYSVVKALALSEAIRAAGSIPSGVLYAQVIGEFTLDAYQQVIAALKRTGLVSEDGHVLSWTGPQIKSEQPRRDVRQHPDYWTTLGGGGESE